MSNGFSGGCLCGAVRYESSAPPQMAAHCQCVDCRKSSGSGHCTHLVSMETDVTLTGDAAIYDRPADSGNIVSRAFCPTCGAPVYSRNSSMPGMIFLRASSLDDPEVAQPQMVVYASRGPSWDHVDPDLPTFPDMPPGGPEAVLQT